MAMSVPKSGFSRMMKDGAKRFQGTEEAVHRNITACTELTEQVKSAYGPQGMNKMVINHIQKLFVTKDASTIMSELEVQHPAAKMIVMACQMQSKEVGDGTNAVIILASALLEHAAELLRMGLTATEIADGYELASQKTLEILKTLVVSRVEDIRDFDKVRIPVRTAIMSKQFGHEDFLADLVTKACLNVIPKNEKSFNVDSVRVAKILGSGVTASQMMNGMVFKRGAEGHVKRMSDAKIAVFTCPFDLTQTETKGTVLINTAEELKNFSKGEEADIEEQVKALADAGFNTVVAGGKFGEMYLHFLNKYGIMCIRTLSKFDLRRLCRTVGATAQTKITVPPPGGAGVCSSVEVEEIGDTSVVAFRQNSDAGRISTIIIRGSSENLMDDIERSINAGVNTFKALSKENGLVAGAGAVEVELARQVTQMAEKSPGLEQYAIRNFALALEALPKQLADNAGAKATEILSKLYAEHEGGKANSGFDCETEGTMDVVEANILDLYYLKHWGIKLATNAATTVLSVDEIIMSKPAGGPKVKGPKAQDEDDDDGMA